MEEIDPDIILTDEGFEKVLELIKNPPKPSPSLLKLFEYDYKSSPKAKMIEQAKKNLIEWRRMMESDEMKNLQADAEEIGQECYKALAEIAKKKGRGPLIALPSAIWSLFEYYLQAGGDPKELIASLDAVVKLRSSQALVLPQK